MIKKLLFVMLCCTVFYTAKSQISKGNWMVGGSGSFSSNNNSSTNEKITNISIYPNIGYFVLDKFSSGLKISYSYQRNSYNGHGVNTNSFNVGPFVRYYFLNKERQLNIFTEAEYLYGTYATVGFYPISNGRSDRYSIALGSVIYFNNSVGLELSISYYNNKDITQDIKNNGIQMSLGFQIHLERL